MENYKTYKGKQEKIKPKTERKQIIMIRVEINEIKIEKTSKIKSWFLEKMNEMNKSVANWSENKTQKPVSRLREMASLPTLYVLR